MRSFMIKFLKLLCYLFPPQFRSSRCVAPWMRKKNNYCKKIFQWEINLTNLKSLIFLILVAFLFNWIGFLLLMCFCHTIAARYGALSGFGLSLAKWTFIVKHSTDLASRENSWLWWLIMAFGLLIFVRAIIQYLNIKRGWRFLSGTAQERLLFFY